VVLANRVLLKGVQARLFTSLLSCPSPFLKVSKPIRFVRGQFKELSEMTVGIAHSNSKVALSNGVTVKLEIWDTCGQERYRALAPL
jgi:hypothetical protein